MGKRLRLEDLEVYKLTMEIGDCLGNCYQGYFETKTLGAQYVAAADSIALNIKEGDGRFHYKENKNFCYYIRGSAKETLTATHKAKTRNLITEEEFILAYTKV